MQSSKPLWIPSETRIERSQMTQFARFLEEKTGLSFPDYPALHQWSVTRVDQFWGLAAEFLGIKWENFPDRSVVLPPEGKMLGAKWFPNGTLSYAANMLSSLNDKTIKIISLIEGCEAPVEWTGGDIYKAVARCSKELSKLGVKPGDRVAGVLPNTAEAIIAMLAANAIGAVWSSCSPDFGQEGILDRFGQIEPKVLFVTTSYLYNAKTIDCRPTIAAIMAKLPTVIKTVAIDLINSGLDVPKTISWSDFLAGGAGAEESFKALATPFDHPLYILFSSGTTGKPKCIVHSVGGALLQHKKELVLHSGIAEGSRLLYFTTCGWMMWNWMAPVLSAEAIQFHIIQPQVVK